ncbi:hypothetical protein GEMRC1_011773 [Eukaryota sp. GEM-RC1]
MDKTSSILESPASTLDIILTERCFSDQILLFRGVVIPVNTFVLAVHSNFFKRLWFGSPSVEKRVNPFDLSYLDVDLTSLSHVIHYLYGIGVPFHGTNNYQLLFLAKYFEIPNLISRISSLVPLSFNEWPLFLKFLAEADQNNDESAIEFIGRYLSSLDEIDLDNLPTLRNQTLISLNECCQSKQSQSWFLKTMVNSYLKQRITLDQFSKLLQNADIDLIPALDLENSLFTQLQAHTELTPLLMEFHFSRLRGKLVEENQQLQSLLNSQSSSLVRESPQSTALPALEPPLKLAKVEELESDLVESNDILFSNVFNFLELEVSDDQKKLTFSGPTVKKNCMGQPSLLPGVVYTWNITFKSQNAAGVIVGIIPKSRISKKAFFR